MNIITLTVNPALDKSALVDGIVPEQKLSCYAIRTQPGGGGINISRILSRLDTESNCFFTSGGDNGKFLESLLLTEHLNFTGIPVKESTRENCSVTDTRTSLQYRFGMPGNAISKSEINVIFSMIKNQVKLNDILVLSGSLAKNIPDNFYAQLIKNVETKKLKIIVDTSGPALLKAIDGALPIHLIKPNQKELAQLAGKTFLSNKEQENFAMHLVQEKNVKYVVVSLGPKGAFMASKTGVIYQRAPAIEVKSTIGAGDSLVAGLIFGIKNKFPPQEMIKFGVACGAATTMSEGTDLATKESIYFALDLLN
jgi:6-phosphofructokinase 2